MNSKTLLFALTFAGGLVFASQLSAQTPAVNFPAASPACTSNNASVSRTLKLSIPGPA